MRHWWENTEVRSLAVHFPPSSGASKGRVPSDLAVLGLDMGEEED